MHTVAAQNTCQWFFPTLSLCEAMSSVSQGPWTNECWLSLMFAKCFSAFSFSAQTHTHWNMDMHEQVYTCSQIYQIDPDRTQLETEWEKIAKRKESNLPSNSSSQSVSVRERFSVISLPNNNQESERQTLGRNLAQRPKWDKNTNARFCMWERKRGRLELHTKSFKSSEARGAVMCRAANWSWHSTVEKKEPGTYKRVKSTKDEAADAGPERKGTHTDHIALTSFAEKQRAELIRRRLHIDTRVHLRMLLYPSST